MPVGQVHGKREEKKWAKAKAEARRQYPHLSEGGEKFWAIVSGIFRKMKQVKDRHTQS